MDATTPVGEDLYDATDLSFRRTVRRYVEAPRFVRRDWLAERVHETMASTNCRMLLLTGEPGSGKSGLVAQLAHDNPTWPVYFIRENQRAVLTDGSARSFLLRVGFQLAATHPELFSRDNVQVSVAQRIGTLDAGGSAVGVEVDRLLASPFRQAVVQIRQSVAAGRGDVVGLRVREWVGDPRRIDLADLAAMALLDPARALARLDPGARIVILVDALDELQHQPEDQTLLPWLASAALPSNVALVLTSRSTAGLAVLTGRQGERLAHVEIGGDDPRVRGDLIAFAQKLVADASVAAALAAADREAAGFVAEVVLKADGNIGYLDALGRAVDAAVNVDGAAGLEGLLRLDHLPDDLTGLYAFFLQQVRTGPGARLVRVDDPASGLSGRAEAWSELYRPMLEVLCAGFEPLTARELHLLSGSLATRGEGFGALQHLLPFLDRVDDRYRLYHATFAEFMTAAGTGGDPETEGLYVDPVTAHRGIAARLRGHLWDGSDPGPMGAVRAYGRRNFVAHLFSGQLWEELYQTLDDPGHGSRRVQDDPSTFSYWSDLGFGLRACVRDQADQAAAVVALPRLWRYALLRNSLAQNADSSSHAVFAALALLGHTDRAVQLLGLMSDPARQASTAMRVCSVLTGRGRLSEAAAFAARADATVEEIVDPDAQTSAIGELLAVRLALSRAGARIDPQALTVCERLARRRPTTVARGEALADVVRLAAGRDDAESVERLLDEIEAWQGDAAEEDVEPLLFVLGALYADLGLDGDAGAAFTMLGADAWLVMRGARALAERYGPDVPVPDLKDRLLSLQEAALGIQDRPQDRCLALARLAAIWRLLDEPAHATVCHEEAVASGLAMSPPDLDVVAELADGLRGSGRDDLLARVAGGTVDAAVASIGGGAGGLLQFNLFAQVAVRGLAEMGDVDGALRVARALPAADGASALVDVVRALADSGRPAEAEPLVGEIEATSRLSRASTAVGVDPLIGDADQTGRARHYLAAGLAATGATDRALAHARQIGGVRARCATEAVVAMELAARDRNAAAEDLLKAHDRDLRLWAAEAGRQYGVPAAMKMLVAARAWPPAMAALPGLSEQMGQREWLVSDMLLDGLLRDGRTDLAREVIERIEARSRAAWLARLAERLPESDRRAVLADAEELSDAVPDPVGRVEALELILRALVAIDEPKARTLLRRAIGILNGVPAFEFRPTPWTRICVDLLLVGDPVSAFDLARRLAIDDFVVAICLISKTGQQRDMPLRYDAMLADAAAAAQGGGVGYLRPDLEARVAVEYARLGTLERALAFEGPASRRAVATYLAGSGRPHEAAEVLGGDGNDTWQADAELAVAGALVEAGDLDGAERVATSLSHPKPRSLALARVAVGLEAAGEGERARTMARECTDLLPSLGWESLDSVEAIAAAVERTGQAGALVGLIRREWIAARDVESLTYRLPLATPLAAERPEIAVDIAGSFAWVDGMLNAL